MANGGFNELPRRIRSGKVLCDKVFAIVCVLQYDGFQFGLASTVYKRFDKKARHKRTRIIHYVQQLLHELHNPITRKRQQRKAYSSYRGNI